MELQGREALRDRFLHDMVRAVQAVGADHGGAESDVLRPGGVLQSRYGARKGAGVCIRDKFDSAGAVYSDGGEADAAQRTLSKRRNNKNY